VACSSRHRTFFVIKKFRLNLFYQLKTFIKTLFLFILLLATQLDAQVNSVYTDTPPAIDGVLDEAMWENSLINTDYKTFVPDYEQDMPYKTITYMAHDAENLYFAFKAFDDPSEVKTSIAARDKIEADDWVGINMDSFNDQQTSYGFFINPNGIQRDTRFAAGEEDAGMDMVWYSSGKINDDGYTIEVKIPLKSIRYANKGGKVKMGLIFDRKISRFSTRGSFPALDPNQGMNFLTQTLPVQYDKVKENTLLEILPAVTYASNKRLEEDVYNTDQNFEPSVTLKYGITSDLILDATINPDFSQVEADASQIEVNQRFAVFYPERRPFFLEGKENFNLAAVGFLSSVNSVVNTRTIVSPSVAAKLSGKLGKKNTISTIFAKDREFDDLGEELNNKATVGVMRYKRAFKNNSYLGAIGTIRDFDENYNLVYGLDGQYRFLESNLFSGNYLRSDTYEAIDGGNDASTKAGSLTLAFEHNTRKREFGVTVIDIDEGFQSDVGQVNRTGIVRFGSNFNPKFYPKKGLIKRIDQTYYYGRIYDKGSKLSEYSIFFKNDFILPKSTLISFAANLSNEVYEAQKFDRSSIRVEANSQLTKRLFVKGSLRFNKGIYYSTPEQGYGKSINGSVIIQASDKLNAEVSYIYSDLFSEETDVQFYNVHIPRAKITYQMNQYLFFRVITQYNNQTRNLAPNFLASFTYIPGTVVFLGYGSNYERKEWDGTDYIDSNQFLETNSGFFFKASYLFRY
jgi:hypothetical protein